MTQAVAADPKRWVDFMMGALNWVLKRPDPKRAPTCPVSNSIQTPLNDVVKRSLGAVVAADVHLVGGEVLLDQSMLNSESVPIEAGAGVQTYAGHRRYRKGAVTGLDRRRHACCCTAFAVVRTW